MGVETASAPHGAEFFAKKGDKMAQATKMGADTATLEKRRKALTGHTCTKCSLDVAFGDLLMVKVTEMQNGRPRSHQVVYHRKCYAV